MLQLINLLLLTNSRPSEKPIVKHLSLDFRSMSNKGQSIQNVAQSFPTVYIIVYIEVLFLLYAVASNTVDG